MTILPAGIPTIESYQALLRSDAFRQMEQFSDRFLKQNRLHLASYARKWVADPLHNWSRQWEYPFVYSCIESVVAEKQRPVVILDAGSGVTFFPYYIQTACPGAQVHTCDRDRSYTEIFKKINANMDKSVAFACTEIRQTDYEDDTFDLVYCISVLEHTKDYAAVIKEFLRITKPLGKLVVTFDVSLDGTRDISPAKAAHLREELLRQYHHEGKVAAPEIESAIEQKDKLTTDLAKDIDVALLPWKPLSLKGRIKQMLKGRFAPVWPPSVTVYCAQFSKPGS